MKPNQRIEDQQARFQVEDGSTQTLPVNQIVEEQGGGADPAHGEAVEVRAARFGDACGAGSRSHSLGQAVEYGAPHQVSRVVQEDSEGDGFEILFVWEDGQIVLEEYYNDEDAAVDASVRRTWDGHLPLSVATDVDGDGVSDVESSYAWEPEDGGWAGTAEGEDSEGTFTLDLWADADGIASEIYDHESGVHREGSRSPLNELGQYTHLESREILVGVYEQVITIDNVLDDVGRWVGETYAEIDAVAGEEPETLDFVTSLVYACP